MFTKSVHQKVFTKKSSPKSPRSKYFIHFLAKLDHSETNDHEHSGKIGLHTVVCAKHLHTLRSLLKMINLLTFVFSFKFTLKASIIGKFLKERSKLLDDLVTKRKTSFRKICWKHHFKLWLDLVFTALLCNFGIQLHISGLISRREILWNCRKTGNMLCQNLSPPKGSAPI